MEYNVLTMSVGKHHSFTIMQKEKHGLVEFALWQGDEMICPSEWAVGAGCCRDVLVGTIDQAMTHLNDARDWVAA